MKTDNIVQQPDFRPGTLTEDMVHTLLSHPYLLGAAVVSMVVSCSIAPSFGWVGKLVVDDFAEEGLRAQTAMPYVPWIALLLAGWLTVRFTTEFARKTYRARMNICLQRTYLARSTSGSNQNDVARVLWDASQGERGLQVVYEDAPKIIAPAVAVLGWQVMLAPAWLPALLVAVVPTFVALLAFGPF